MCFSCISKIDVLISTIVPYCLPPTLLDIVTIIGFFYNLNSYRLEYFYLLGHKTFIGIVVCLVSYNSALRINNH